MPFKLVLAAALAFAGCGPVNHTPAPAGGPLVGSLQVTPLENRVDLTLLITNVSEQPVELTFRSGQSFDFEVSRGGREVWRWSAERVFTQAIRQETVAAGETLRYRASWRPPAGAAGEYRVTGRLSADYPLEQSSTFRLP
ncbi:MAG: BsuPI-related putative proteinase inhibitor [Longimicrobiaceae bacterium]